MLPHDPRKTSGTTHCRFFDLAENKFFNINNAFREFHSLWCVGSSHGVLMILDEKANPHLLSPLSQLEIQLPPTSTLFESSPKLQQDCSSPYFVQKFQKMYISKAALLLDRFRLERFLFVAVIFGFYPIRLAFCKPGDNAWNQFGSPGRSYKDLIFYNGMLYVLLSNGSNAVEVEVEVWDFRTDFPEKVFDILDRLITISEKVTPYLVESMGELLFVLQIKDVPEDCAIGFAIYKLDCSGKRWVAMETLSDRALFISEKGSVSLSTCDFPEARENLIYFKMGSIMYLHDDHNISIYNFKEKKITVNEADDQEDDYCRRASPSFWFVPNLI